MDTMADVLTRRETARPERISPPSPRPPRHRRFGVAVVALLSVLAIGLGVSMGEGQARAASAQDIINGLNAMKSLNPATGIGNVVAVLINNKGSQAALEQWRIQACGSGASSGGADCSGSTGTGIAIVMPGQLELTPNAIYKGAQSIANNEAIKTILGWFGIDSSLPDAAAPFGDATVIGDGFQFAMASTGGKATAISYLPVSLATAGASGGRTAYAFALVGIANAWTTDDIPIVILSRPTGLTIPGIKTVGCYGGLTAAYAEGVGACANVLGTFDFRFNQLDAAGKSLTIPQVQFALTDPSAVLTDPAGVFGKVITDIFAGKTPTLSKDFTRLSLGGNSLLALTSDYGLSAPITVNWLGSTITIYPTATINGATRPNMLALPQIVTGDLDTSQIIPVITIPQITFPFGLAPLGPYVSSTPALTTTSARTLAATKTTTSRAARSAATDAETGATSSSSSTTTSSTTPSTATSSSTTSTTVSSSSSTSRSSQSSTSSGTRTSAPSAAPTSSAGTDTGTDSGGTQSSGGVPAASPAG
ncbi:hypothetical protein GPOL_c37350 [Gordonia polyisoprenivorans VH2]|uniref:Uncharacterized protein n=2 Tax=Gordonia polyisoprenivorans TaxID=84595 RepID=H6N2X0_GORPV|nr:hypothetical protein GPOL_c37350 [Gordonia polyisoprenivorans VH2]